MSEASSGAAGAPEPAPATQVQHPWRATVRTILAATLGILPALPIIVEAAGLAAVPWVAGGLAAVGAVTRVLALPVVDDWLSDYLPWLSARGRSR